MRQIKFKAKRLDGKGWIEGTPICINGKPYGIMIGEKESPDIDPSTICQFTGLKDCKGNEIWEHDLLQNQEAKAIYEVVWDENGGFIIKYSVGGGHLLNFLGSILSVFKFKVVGNKFDRKEGKE
ncbi:YopX family protein [Segatella copri]|uniref:YopX family protein n=1 Tax=Segatella copri TaxID=165179 RepID=UPI001F47A055|nr:YopX family protein [Segatella copri]